MGANGFCQISTHSLRFAESAGASEQAVIERLQQGNRTLHRWSLLTTALWCVIDNDAFDVYDKVGYLACSPLSDWGVNTLTLLFQHRLIIYTRSYSSSLRLLHCSLSFLLFFAFLQVIFKAFTFFVGYVGYDKYICTFKSDTLLDSQMNNHFSLRCYCRFCKVSKENLFVGVETFLAPSCSSVYPVVGAYIFVAVEHCLHLPIYRDVR